MTPPPLNKSGVSDDNLCFWKGLQKRRLACSLLAFGPPVSADLLLDHEHGYIGRIYPRNPGGLAQTHRAQGQETLPGLNPQAGYAGDAILAGWQAV